MTNIQVGQIWSDSDKRRIGRTFRVANIDSNIANCVMVVGGKRKNTKIRLNRFKPKYYKFNGFVSDIPQDNTPQDNTPQDNTPQSLGITPHTSKVISGEEFSNKCYQVLRGNWGGFGSYALFNSENISILIRRITVNNNKQYSYDIKVRLNSHLIYSLVSTESLRVTINAALLYLEDIKYNITDVLALHHMNDDHVD